MPILVLGLATLGLMTPIAGGQASAGHNDTTRTASSRAVIVRASSAREAGRAVLAAGGHVDRRLAIVDGVAATVPADKVRPLAGSPGVEAVTPDSTMHVQSVGPPAAQLAVNPVSVYGDEVEAGRVRAMGWRGQGVTVALLDTGISGEDLTGRVKPVTNALGETSPCENLSGEPTCRDTYGHGTFMAGIIAGSGAASGGLYTGIAPRASLVSIKVASADGSSDVSNVLAGIQWAVSFRTQYHIDILNLSLGTDSTQSWKVDPLNYAVERAWAAGITVVVAASNRGPTPGTIAKPADDPWVITVGAVDDRRTTPAADDVSPDFSARGPTSAGVAKPDIAAPGAHLVSLRSVGSTIDNAFPQQILGAYHQGSGTSMSAAVVSGVAALLLSAHPATAPNRLKYALTSTARPPAITNPSAVGRGVVDAYKALSAPPGQANRGLAHSSPSVLQTSLDPTRGTVRVQTGLTHTLIQGTQTAQLLAWDPVGFLTGDWSANTWYLGPWALHPVYSTEWYGSRWAGMDTDGCTPDATPDDDCLYGGHNWEGSEWYGSWD